MAHLKSIYHHTTSWNNLRRWTHNTKNWVGHRSKLVIKCTSTVNKLNSVILCGCFHICSTAFGEYQTCVVRFVCISVNGISSLWCFHTYSTAFGEYQLCVVRLVCISVNGISWLWCAPNQPVRLYLPYFGYYWYETLVWKQPSQTGGNCIV